MKSAIKLADVGIESVRIKRAITGATIVEVPGPEAQWKADALSGRITTALQDMKVTVARPIKKAELRVKGLEDSFTLTEVRESLARVGGCPPEAIDLGPIKTGPDGMGVVWARCLAAATHKAAALGRVQIGWTRVGWRCWNHAPSSATNAWRWVTSGSAAPTRQIAVTGATDVANPVTALVIAPPRPPIAHYQKAGQEGRTGGLGKEAAPDKAPPPPRPPLPAGAGEAVTEDAGRQPAPTNEDSGHGGSAEEGHPAPPPTDGNGEGAGVNPPPPKDGETLEEVEMVDLSGRGSGLGIASEPYRVPREHPNWASDRGGSVAIHRSPIGGSPPMTTLESGRGYVAVEFAGIAVVGCYVSPNWGLAQFGGFLAEVGGCVGRCAPRPVLVAGDFNAKSRVWGSPRSHARGETLVDWAASLGLCILNTGSEGTAPTQGRPGSRPRRWQRRKLDGDRLIASLLAATWAEHGPTDDVEEEAVWLRDIMTDACDVSMPRAGGPPNRRAAYWWTEEIAELRRASVHARRRFLRARRPGNATRIDDAYGVYRQKQDSMRRAIATSKEGAWEEFLRGVDGDP
ncbi:uncharacterized protein LOC105275209 [Ooceraea biroi]|uniref:uncharacterized protein LOC105275209 n=1 Tax=Ooceraea biroi TaxID=2015173 RepID=UPI000F097AB4|nr:uncharacterized protein LOC105275209 [Ooceraea biroi]